MINPADREVAIFGTVRRLEASQRAAFLDGACAGDAALRLRVEQLLLADAELGTFLESPATPPPGPGATVRRPVLPVEKPGDRIGRYKILEQIGEGGCGVVYMAEQQEPVRRMVALKVIKLGMDTKSVMARFEAERQAMALMDHPNIARVLDAGATDAGRPYFVMELVRGVKITDYCDGNNLSTRARIDLFLQVCQAVQHAHQKGIIHRDLKPSNILVTVNDGVPVPKVIDFGIAKATQGRLTDQTLFTAFQQFIGTPAYMSPEQAVMTSLDIDTRTDIYSLGVLLYELLTGRTPFDAQMLLESGLDKMRSTICDHDPVRPSLRLGTLHNADLATLARLRQTEAPKLIHSLEGDLDWIVMKALEKDRKRRYETANGLARDIERHLNEQPVVARPPSTVYLLHKMFRRHRLAVTAIAAVVAALVFGLGLSTWLFLQERKVRQRAVTAERSARNEALRAEATSAEAKKTLELSYFLQATRLNGEGYRSDALAYLVRILSTNPTNGAVLTRVVTLLTYHPWMVPTVVLQNCNRADFSPDGRRIVTGSLANVLRVWDAFSGQPLIAPIQHGGFVESVQFSPDGRQIASASWDGTAGVWDASNGQPLFATLKHVNQVRVAAFSPDGNRIVTAGNDGTVQVWDARSGQALTSPMKHGAAVITAEFSGDGNKILSASYDNTARVWNARTGRPLTGPLQHAAWVNSAHFSPDGNRIVTASYDHTAQVWDARTGLALLGPLKHAATVRSAEFSPDGRRVVTASVDNTARVWDSQTGLPLTSPLTHDKAVRSAHFSPDGRRVLTASWDKTARVWDAETGLALTEPLKSTAGLFDAKFSPDGARILTIGYDNAVRVWDASGRAPLNEPLRHEAAVLWVRFSPDGTKIATASDDNTARIWNAADGRANSKPLIHSGGLEFQAGRVESAEFSPDGTRLVTASHDHTARIWDVATGQALAKPLQHDAALKFAQFSPDGRRIVTASFDFTARVWDTETGNPLTPPMRHKNIVTWAEFSPDGRRLVTASADHTARVWDSATGQPVTAPLEHSEVVWSATFSPDGKWIVTASADKSARVWDSETGKPLKEFSGHLNDVIWAHFSPDGQKVVTASWDQSARVWDVRTGLQLTEPMEHRSGLSQSHFSPDGKRILTAGDDSAARVWDAQTGLPLTEPLTHEGEVWNAQFSPDGKRIVTASQDHTARIWDLAPAPASCPAWLLPLAEAISGEVLNQQGLLEETRLNRAETLAQIREKLKTTADDGDWVVWGRWFLADPSFRTISPFSTLSVQEYIENRIQEQTPESLNEAEALAKGNTGLLARISQARERLVNTKKPKGPDIPH